MRGILAIVVWGALQAVVSAEILSVELDVFAVKGGGWTYAIRNDGLKLKSDAELATYLKNLTNPLSAIELYIESDDLVPTSQLIKILTYAEANRQGIDVRRVRLHKSFEPRQ